MTKSVRGIRGAITVPQNDASLMKEATKQLLTRMVDENQVAVSEIASIFFTTTRDLDACFPAAAARELGWTYVPMLCSHEMEVPGSIKRTIRVLMHVNTEKSQQEIRHIYLGEAASLRPDMGAEDDTKK